MPICKKCGKQYSIWTAQWGKGRCNPCIEQAQAEQERGLAFRDGGYNQDVLDSRGIFKEKAFAEQDLKTIQWFPEHVEDDLQDPSQEWITEARWDRDPIISRKRAKAAQGEAL